MTLFGYVKPVIKELLVKEYEFYRATYCGICKSMKKHTGLLSNVTLTYDSVFLALLRMAYVEDSFISVRMGRCFLHPIKKRCILNDSPALEYTADAFAILTYYKMMDDIHDEGLGKRLAVGAVRPIAGRAKKKAEKPSLEDIVRDKLLKIREMEDRREASVDAPAELFGELLGRVFSYGIEGEGALVLDRCGYHLGKFIYCIDAADDYEEDFRSGSYNPYCVCYGTPTLSVENKKMIKTALLLECKELENAINLIPFGKKITAENIVRNIIYLGLVKKMEFLDCEEK